MQTRAATALAAAALACAAGVALWLGRPLPPPRMPPPVLALAPAVTVALASDQPPGLTPLDWTAQGRIRRDPPPGTGLTHEWPGTAVLARFTGDAVAIVLDDSENRFRISIDGSPAALVTRPGRATVTLAGLGPGPHDLRLDRLSQAAAPQRIDGLYVLPPGTALPPPPAPRRTLLVYGDSDSVGYGSAGDGRDCPGDGVFLLTDSTLAWPALLARRVGASATVIARSGMGLIRGLPGTPPGANLQDLHARALPSDPATVTEPPAWAVLVEIGANDLSTPPRPGEPWPDETALKAAFTRAYTAFLRRIAAENPGRPVLVLALPDAGRPHPPEIEAAVRALQAENLPVTLVPLPPLDHRGCNWHPSARDHGAIAGAAADALTRLAPPD